MYLNYDEYVQMGGTLSEAAFADVEYEARTYIDWITFSRVKRMYKRTGTVPAEVKECIYHIGKLIANKLALINGPVDGSSSMSGRAVASQSNDGVSVSFNVLSAKEILDSSESELTKLVSSGLAEVRDDLDHRLTYRGLYPDE